LIINRGHRRANAPQTYKRAHEDCNVPQCWATDQRLAQWVSEQRTYKKAPDRGEPKLIITAARVAKLDGLGFAWEMTAAAISKQISKGNRDDAGWAQLAKLKAYKRKHGDCNVPNRWAEDPPLGNWVKNQRQCKKVFELGKTSEEMMAARAAKLGTLGFAWEAPGGENRDDVGWERWLAKLKEYQRAHGDCSVPMCWAEDPGAWHLGQKPAISQEEAEPR
jgi:hypothetical protein